MGAEVQYLNLYFQGFFRRQPVLQNPFQKQLNCHTRQSRKNTSINTYAHVIKLCFQFFHLATSDELRRNLLKRMDLSNDFAQLVGLKAEDLSASFKTDSPAMIHLLNVLLRRSIKLHEINTQNYSKNHIHIVNFCTSYDKNNTEFYHKKFSENPMHIFMCCTLMGISIYYNCNPFKVFRI